MKNIKLIVGLGNPGKKYEQTRHNVGFLVLEKLAEFQECKFVNHLQWRAHIAQFANLGVLLMKPQTFMNLSGQSVSAALRFYKWKPEDILVIYDDCSLPSGALRFRQKGSAGGHNGIKSIIQHLGTEDFARLKIGIGAPKVCHAQAKDKDDTQITNYVLGKFTLAESKELENTLERACEAVHCAHQDGLQAAANTYNTKQKV